MIHEFALFLFTTLAGIAAGAYVARALFPLKSDCKRPWLFGLIALVMLAVSGVALLLHLGHPERMLGAFNNLGSGLAQEGVTTVLFGIAVFADTVLGFAKRKTPRWLAAVAAVLGVAMTVTMGFAYYAFVGTPAWATPATVPFFIVGDLAMGAGFYLLFGKEALLQKAFAGYHVVVEVVALVVLCIMAVHVAGVGYSAAPYVVGAVVGPVLASVFTLVGMKRDKVSFAYAVCICAIVGIAVARYAFYTASIV